MCWSGGKEQSKEAFATDGNQKKKKENGAKSQKGEEWWNFGILF